MQCGASMTILSLYLLKKKSFKKSKWLHRYSCRKPTDTILYTIYLGLYGKHCCAHYCGVLNLSAYGNVTKTWQKPWLPHSPEDFLVWLVWVLVIRHNTWLEVFLSSSIPWVSLGISSAREKPPIAQFISTRVISVPLRPGHHQEAQTTSQRQPQDKGQSRPEQGQKGGKTHIWQLWATL